MLGAGKTRIHTENKDSQRKYSAAKFGFTKKLVATRISEKVAFYSSSHVLVEVFFIYFQPKFLLNVIFNLIKQYQSMNN